MIRKTINKGESWEAILSIQNFIYLFSDIFYVDTMRGWVVGQENGTNTYSILHTADGGETWDEQSIEEPYEAIAINCVCFVNDTIGWIGTTGEYYSSIFHTCDGGENWLLQQEFESPVYDIHMLNQDTGWAVGGDFVYYINTGGVTINEPPLEIFDVIINPNPTKGIIVLDFQDQLPANEYELEITSISGTPVLKKIINNKDYTIDISKQPCGMYFISIKCRTNNKNRSLTKKIIKL